LREKGKEFFNAKPRLLDIFQNLHLLAADKIDISSCTSNKTMTNQRVTIELPEPVFRQLAWIAEATQQSVEVLVAQSVVSNLPPSPQNAPTEMQSELLLMPTLSIDQLLAVAHAQVEVSQHKRHVELLDKNQEDTLTPQEREELTDLRLAAEQLMLRKAYA
jgi:hypothetical protein